MPLIISVTDDEATFRLRFRLTLQKVGIMTRQFKTYATSDEFIPSYVADKQAGDQHDIIFLDINLKASTMDGFEILEELRQRLNGGPVIAIISTSSQMRDVLRAQKLGASCYMVKSGSLQIFSERIREFRRDFIDNRINEFRLYGGEDIK